MIKKIKVDKLKPGIFIHDLNCDWMQHPFLSNKLKIKNEKIVERIIKYGISEVYIDTDKGLDIDDAPLKEEVDREIQCKINKITQATETASCKVPLKKELVRAKEIIKETKKIMHTILDDVRLGRQIEMQQVEHVVDKVAESIFHNKDALLSLIRIKKKDEYTYQHSLAVCALLISFAEHLNFDYETIKAVGTGGLLHDIGKVKIPADILNKKARLTEGEFEKMKAHVDYGCHILNQIRSIDIKAVNVAAHHHERLDGTGYPFGLKGEEISIYGQITSVVDVYDALTSNRCYQNRVLPTDALRKLFEWSETYFSKSLVEQFICCIGIYPVGTLVRLESGLLGIVIEHGEKGLLYPVVRIVYDTKKENFLMPYEVNLSDSTASGLKDMITNYEAPEKWGITPEMYL